MNKILLIVIVAAMVGCCFGCRAFAQEGNNSLIPASIIDILIENFKKSWQTAWALWQKIYGGLWGLVEPFWQKFLSWLLQVIESVKDFLLGEFYKRKPGVEDEFEKEKEEMKEDIKKEAPKTGKTLWEKFRDLIK
jgi:hypothetical protein